VTALSRGPDQVRKGTTGSRPDVKGRLDRSPSGRGDATRGKQAAGGRAAYGGEARRSA